MSTATASPPPETPPSSAVDWAAPRRLALGAAVVGLGVYVVAGLINLGTDEPNGLRNMLSAYLAGWVYWFSLPLGATALLMIHYLAKTSWGILLKRSFESATRTLPLMVVLFVPFAALALTAKDHPVYWWVNPDAGHGGASHAAEKHADKHDATPEDARREKAMENSEQMVKTAVAHEQEARRKGNYSFLSPQMFVLLGIVYFAIWGALIYFLNKWGNDAERDASLVEPSLEKLKNISGPGLIIYAITITAAVSQWVMSLQEGWASTMFPVIFAVNQFLTCFALCVAIFLLLVSRPPFRDVMRPKFQLDMGSLMLAFTLFWSYTSFSQMMLIWIGNLPEEIPFFLKRSNLTGWWYVSAVLIVFHFGLPFILLLFRDIKLHPVRLRMMAIYLLVVCAIDVVWWIEPTHAHHSPLFVLMDVGAVLGIGGVWGLAFLYHLKQRPLLPMNETYMLPEGHHEHH